jgi:hypothetical protein
MSLLPPIGPVQFYELAPAGGSLLAVLAARGHALDPESDLDVTRTGILIHVRRPDLPSGFPCLRIENTFLGLVTTSSLRPRMSSPLGPSNNRIGIGIGTGATKS